MEAAIQSFYEKAGEEAEEAEFSVADILDEMLGGPWRAEDIESAIQALCKAGVDGVSPPAYKVTEDDNFGLIDQ